MDTLLENRYKILRTIGSGGFGDTFLAQDTYMPSGRHCALKQLKPINHEPQIYQLVKERFQREAAILEELGNGSDRIPKLYAYFESNGQFYLVQEYIEGNTLTARVQQQGTLSESSVKQILVNLLAVLDYVHSKRIVHRDLKPDNIILRQADELPVLIDFGTVKETMGTLMSTSGRSTQSVVFGTPGFMPSEQAAGRPVYASDIYSLGLTAIYLLTGKMPQELETDPLTGDIVWRRHALSISPTLATVIDKAIQPNARERYSTAKEMLDALNGMETLATSLPSATIVSSAPPASSGLNTQIVAPANYSSQIPSVVPSTNGEWKKAAIVGGLIGAAILLSTLLIREPLLNALKQSPEESEKESPAVSQTQVTTTPSQIAQIPNSTATATPISTPILSQTFPVQPFQPSPQPIDPAPVNPVSSISTNATIVGDPGSKNIRSGPGTTYAARHIAYPGDRVLVKATSKDRGGYTWYNIYFPKSGAEGWIAGQLLAVDGQSYPQPSRSSAKPSGTNATIVGEPGSKNLRSGPGTAYSARHIAYPGDRVQILASDYDRGGYLWYKVYFPKSGAQGWIAAQLINKD